MNKQKKRDLKKTKNSLQIINFLVVSLFILFAVWAIYNKHHLENFTVNSVNNYGLIALFIVNFFLEFIPQLITPVFTYVPVFLLNMNIFLSMIVIVLGSFVGSVSGYFFGRKFGHSTIESFMDPKKSKKVINFMNNYGRFAVFFAAITPLPYVPMIIGSLKLSKRNFFFFGIIPRAVALILFGYLFYLGIF